MAAEEPATEFDTWSAAGHAIQIQYSKELMNSISEAAWEGLQKVPRRGLEIGGVLYGERDGEEIRILEWRPIGCEHSSGPSFDLSARDKESLRLLLNDPAGAPEELLPVGWFHSHTKDGVSLSEEDLALYQTFFPGNWQVALVLRPHTYEAPRAGFFFREEDGSVQAEKSYGEFELSRRSRRLPVGFDPSNPQLRSPLRDGSPASVSRAAPLATPAAAEARSENRTSPSLAPEFAVPDAAEVPRPQTSRRWSVWLIAAVPVVAVLVLLIAPLLDTSVSDVVGLQAWDSGGQLVVEWNHAAAPVIAAEGGSLRIADGSNQYELELSGEELRTGSITYVHETGDVEFQLDLRASGGETRRELTRFLGEAPSSASAAAEDSGQRQLLEAEAELLQQRLAEEAARNLQLRETVDQIRGNLPAR